MGEPQKRVRLRQAVLVAEQLEPVAEALRSALGLGEPFRDPGVATFGLTNAVFALGDCFLEVISPARPDTAAGRYMARHGGGGGYMVIFDLDDLEGARERAQAAGVRVVWQIDLPDISGTHLHPADMRGAIVSLDRSSPYGSWRWGGPEWTARTGEGAPGRLAGVTIAVAEPDEVAARGAPGSCSPPRRSPVRRRSRASAHRPRSSPRAAYASGRHTPGAWRPPCSRASTERRARGHSRARARAPSPSPGRG